MNILIISAYYPMPDRASGELRFFQLLKMLADRYEVSFCSIAQKTQFKRIGEKETINYRLALESLGISVIEGGVVKGLKEKQYDAVIFEFWKAGRHHMKFVRTHQSDARIIVDSVDIGYHRLFSKAKFTGQKQDLNTAETRKIEELTVYKSADVVITVTDEDARVLQQDVPGEIRTITIPNIHVMHAPVEPGMDQRKSLIFIGNFKHEPNRDAVHYFYDEIWPIIKNTLPDVCLKIIGNAPPESISSLASENIDVLGYVPETDPYLKSSGISIAPLRFGAGMKGKIGEAMSYGLPVVTTTIGIEGFGLTPGENVMVGDTPEEFAKSVIKLINEEKLYEHVRMAGYHFIAERYSEPAVRNRVYEIFDNLGKFPVRKAEPIKSRLARIFGLFREETMN